MGNRDSARGLVPRYHQSGDIRTEPVSLTAANTIIGRGDPLRKQTDGTYDRAAVAGPIDAVAAEQAAASAGGTIQAYVDPQIVYSAQTDDGTGTGTVQDAMTLNFDFVIGNATNGISIMELDESSANTTATLALKAEGLYQSPDNALGEFNEILVTLNNTQRKGGTGTAGV